jgi:hypothetical protein
MPKDKSRIKGKMSWTVRDKDGNIKRYKNSWIRDFLGLPERLMQGFNNNIVTNEGDALIVDMLVTTGTRTAVDNANGVIGVGDGFVSALKTTDALVNQIGSDKAMSATYPKQKGAFAATDDNVIQYRSIFAAGEATGTGLDEALLGNGTDTLAYAEISPSVNKGASDTLQIDWELTFLGS